MGGNTRNPKDYMFKKPVPLPKVKDSEPPKNIAPNWIDLEELVFGKPKPKKPKKPEQP